MACLITLLILGIGWWFWSKILDWVDGNEPLPQEWWNKKNYRPLDGAKEKRKRKEWGKMLHPGGCPHPTNRIIYTNDEAMCLGCGTILAHVKENEMNATQQDPLLELRARCKTCLHPWVLKPSFIKGMSNDTIILDCKPEQLECPNCAEVSQVPHFCGKVMDVVEELWYFKGEKVGEDAPRPIF